MSTAYQIGCQNAFNAIENYSRYLGYYPGVMELSASFSRALLDGFEAAYSHLLRVTARSTGCREDARELVHDTWLKLAEHVDGGCADASAPQRVDASAPRDVSAYLTTMAQNLALDHLRRGQRLAHHVREEAQQAALAPRRAPDVAEAVMYRQALGVLQAALASLPERTRTVFLAHRVHGEKQPAIAERLGMSVNTVERDLILAADCIEDALHRWSGTSNSEARATAMGRRRNLCGLLGLAGLSAGGMLAWQQWGSYHDTHVQWQVALASQRGQLVRHTLQDGSSLQLDAQSQAEVRYYAAQRLVNLTRGAAFFDVTRDAARPFVVTAGAVRVTVLGTRFGVERQGNRADGGDVVLVQVASGHVRVEAPGMAARELRADQGLRIAPDGSVVATHGQAASWREGELVFGDATLGEALERLSRYTPSDLRATPGAARLPLSGRVRIAQAQAWLDALPRAMPVRLRRQVDGGVLVALRDD
ncbi:sigma-70 family RNA polymerase sigma factor [Variovorax boronicumulans]|uniref:sigma-70 family RNA polymerase sigma factor n=1 Tax=Variovorax boronicumulans TaxID=436515 RepID=UPI0036F377CD